MNDTNPINGELDSRLLEIEDIMPLQDTGYGQDGSFTREQAIVAINRHAYNTAMRILDSTLSTDFVADEEFISKSELRQALAEEYGIAELKDTTHEC